MRLSIKLNVWKFRIFVMMSFILFERKKIKVLFSSRD